MVADAKPIRLINAADLSVRLRKRTIAEDVTVFDELAVLRQVAGGRGT